MSISQNVTPRVKGTAKKRPTVAADKRAATDLWALIVKRGQKCEACYDHRDLEAAHIIRRAKSGTRTELENGMCLCRACHTYLDNHIADLIEWVDRRRGAGTYRRLQAQADAHTGSAITAAAFWRSERARLNDIAKELGLK